MDFYSQRDYDNYVDYTIVAISDDWRNRWSGTSHGDGGGTKLDPPDGGVDRMFAKGFGTALVSAVKDAYTAQGYSGGPGWVENMLVEIEKCVAPW
jgi:hypothetical protein